MQLLPPGSIVVAKRTLAFQLHNPTDHWTRGGLVNYGDTLTVLACLAKPGGVGDMKWFNVSLYMFLHASGEVVKFVMHSNAIEHNLRIIP